MATKIDQLVDQIGGLRAVELAQLTKALEETFGVSAAAMAVGPVPASGQEKSKAEEEQSEYSVELIDPGSDKIKIIKAVRQVKKDLGLTEAKKLVESTPIVLLESAPKDEAQKIKEAIEAAGGKVKLS